MGASILEGHRPCADLAPPCQDAPGESEVFREVGSTGSIAPTRPSDIGEVDLPKWKIEQHRPHETWVGKSARGIPMG